MSWPLYASYLSRSWRFYLSVTTTLPPLGTFTVETEAEGTSGPYAPRARVPLWRAGKMYDEVCSLTVGWKLNIDFFDLFDGFLFSFCKLFCTLLVSLYIRI